MLHRLRQPQHQLIALCLALVAVLYRGLIPMGYMPVASSTAGLGGVEIAICAASFGGQQLLTGQHDAGAVSAAHCAFAAVTLASPPTPIGPRTSLALKSDSPAFLGLAALQRPPLRWRPPARAPPRFA